ncbi:uncharacterized protein LOC142644020 [Castanea sativa]|uniref:uncharacterized protein LOC142644020 n=1 Tax=Castanea sativa TaxID=21020 RepID=UPI003F653F8B
MSNSNRKGVSSSTRMKTAKLMSKSKKLKGPMDSFVTLKPKKVVELRKHGKMKQTNICDKFDKEKRAQACQYIGRLFYIAGIPFNVACLYEFKWIVEAIGQYSPNMKPPSYHELRVSILKKEVAYTNELLSAHKESWMKHGGSIMSDEWTSRTNRTLMNFLVNCPSGTMFVKSIDASSFMKTGEKTFELLDSFVDQIGKANVVQVVLDNGFNYVLVGKLLEVKWPNFYILKVMGPLVRVLHLVDNERKPAMGYIYEAMDRAKEAIIKAFNENEERLVPRTKIQDKIMLELSMYKKAEGLLGIPLVERSRKTRLGIAEWWSLYGSLAPFLQQLTIKILSLTCSECGCEHNWSVFEQYNQKTKARYDKHDVIDPISLNDIDESNEWLLGEMCAESSMNVEDELVFDDDDDGLTWGVVARVVGVGEPRKNTRFQTKSRASSKASTSQPNIEKEYVDYNETEEENVDGYKFGTNGFESNGNLSEEFDDDL